MAHFLSTSCRDMAVWLDGWALSTAKFVNGVMVFFCVIFFCRIMKFLKKIKMLENVLLGNKVYLYYYRMKQTYDLIRVILMLKIFHSFICWQICKIYTNLSSITNVLNLTTNLILGWKCCTSNRTKRYCFALAIFNGFFYKNKCPTTDNQLEEEIELI